MDEMTPVREVVVNLLNELDACETGGDRISYLTKFLREFRSLPRAESEVVESARGMLDCESMHFHYLACDCRYKLLTALRKHEGKAGEKP